MAELEIKNKEPRFRLVVQEYAGMFSGLYLRLLLVSLCIVAGSLAIWFLVPSTNGALRVLQFVTGFVWIVGGCFTLFWFVSPILARVVFPLALGILEVIRLLLLFVQYMIDRVVIQGMVESDLYPPNNR